MKQNALDAPAKANGLAVLTALVYTGKVYTGKADPKAVARRRAKKKARR